jgi:RNA-directed DNA polymerase
MRMVGDDLGRDDASAERANWYLRREWIALSDGLRLMNRTREQEVSKLLRAVWSIHALERAWRVIQANAQTSKSLEVRREVDEFRENAASNLRSISSRLSAKTFKFQPAKGIPILKKDAHGNNIPGKFRPIVLANIESRIVQRSILEALMSVPELSKYIHTPNSFGGIRKKSKEDASAVPAAIGAVLGAIGDGANFLMSADIEKFFTRIPKSKVIPVIASAVNDEAFIKLLQDAIAVELSNMALLKEKADAFPLYDVGVAQGNSLSPLLGNILLYEFDQRMNDRDCRCIRYIDDIVILAPNRRAANAKMKLAKKLIASFEMSFGAAKTQVDPIQQRYDPPL